MRREKGAPKKTQLGFRASDAMRDFVEGRSQRDNIGLSEIVRDACEMYRDLYEALGVDTWYELRKRAGIADLTIGVVLARLVSAAMEAERRPNSKKP